MSRGPLSRVVVGAGKANAKKAAPRRATRFTEHETNSGASRGTRRVSGRAECPDHDGQPRNACEECNR